MLRRFLLGCFILIFGIGYSQMDIPTDYTTIDEYANQAEKTHTTSVESLAEYLSAHSSNPFLKLRAIYTWTTSNIKYDWYQYTYNEHLPYSSIPKTERKGLSAFGYWFYSFRLNTGLRKMYKLTTTEKILKRKKAVCHNYAQLVNELCFESGLRSMEIIGYLKDENFQKRDKLYRSNHSWNAVAIAKGWHMLDVTNNFWITDKDSLNRFMLPSDPIWQLKEEPISVEEFSADSVGEYYWDSYDYMDSISQLIGKEPIDFLLQSGLNSKRHNLINNRDVAYAYFNHANFNYNKAKNTKNDYDIAMEAYNTAKASFDSSKVYLKQIKRVEIKEVGSTKKTRNKELFTQNKTNLKLAIKLEQKNTKTFERSKKDYLKLIKDKYKKMIDSVKQQSVEHVASIDATEKLEIKKVKAKYKTELDTLKIKKEAEVAFIEKYNEEQIKEYTKSQEKKIKGLEKELKSEEKRNSKAIKAEIRRLTKEKKANKRDTDYAKKMSKVCKAKYKKMKNAYYTKG